LSGGKVKRYFLEVAYKGTNYSGWQIQKNAVSVQEELNKVLKVLFGNNINTLGSGRTDTGVHAEQQFVQIDLEKALTPEYLYKINRMLPEDISVREYFLVNPEANARFDAISRRYEYRIVRVKNPFLFGFTYLYPRPLDITLLNKSSELLLNYSDFQSFSKVKTSVENFLCTIHKAEWEERGDLLIFHVEANRFLRGMVRALVGTLIEVGLGKMSIEEFKKILDKKDRKAAGRAAPPEGLFLCEVKYPKEIFLKD